jgi:hypothetical protein
MKTPEELIQDLENNEPISQARFLVIALCGSVSKSEPDRLAQIKDAIAHGGVPLGFVGFEREELEGSEHVAPSIQVLAEHADKSFVKELLTRWAGVAIRKAFGKRVAWRH